MMAKSLQRQKKKQIPFGNDSQNCNDKGRGKANGMELEAGS
jgi:hypothetical protein